MNYDFNSFNDFTGGRYRPNTGKPPHMSQDEWDQVLFEERLYSQIGRRKDKADNMWHNKYKGEKQIDFNKLNWKPLYNIADVVPYIQRENETSDIIAYVAFKLKGSEEGVTLSRPDAMCLMQWLDFPKASDPKLKQKMQMIFDVVINNALFPYPVEELI